MAEHEISNPKLPYSLIYDDVMIRYIRRHPSGVLEASNANEYILMMCLNETAEVAQKVDELMEEKRQRDQMLSELQPGELMTAEAIDMPPALSEKLDAIQGAIAELQKDVDRLEPKSRKPKTIE